MKKINLKKFIMTSGVLIAAGLTAYGITKLNDKKIDSDTKKTSIETTTEVSQEEYTTEEIITNDNEINEYDINSLIESKVENNYNAYKDYYDEVGLDVNAVRNISLVINDLTDDLSKEEVMDATDAINFMYDSIQLETAIDNIYYGQKKINVADIPRASELILDENSKSIEILKRIEDAEASIVDSIRKTDDYESVLPKINEEVVRMEYETIDDNMGRDLSDVDNAGMLYTISVAKKGLINLCSHMNPGKEIITGSETNKVTGEKQEVRIALTSKEQDLENDILHAQMNGLEVSESKQDEYTKALSKLNITKYNEASCSYQNKLVEQRLGYAKTLTK